MQSYVLSLCFVAISLLAFGKEKENAKSQEVKTADVPTVVKDAL